MVISILVLLLIFIWVFFIFSVVSGDEFLVFISSCGLVLIGIFLMVNGIENLNNWVTRMLAFIQLGIGMLGLLEPFVGIEGWD